jgi:hypothetical protein
MKKQSYHIAYTLANLDVLILWNIHRRDDVVNQFDENVEALKRQD